jgi:predicted alpha/beta-fold hydrolase
LTQLPVTASPTYRAPGWLPGGHAQTIYPLARRGLLPRYRRERWDTPDGDFIDLDWLASPADADAPLVVLFHGLEGSSASHYARALMRALAHRGWAGVVPHFRGCSGEPNRLPRAYHSGDSAEIDWILRRLRTRFPRRTIHASGVSLGGNALLKWLGEQEAAARDVVQAAAAVCAPVDLTAAGHALEQGFNLVYARRFLVTLKRNAAAKLARHPGLFDARRMRAAGSLREFDDAVTAPLHGFRDVGDYWRRASAKPWLPGVRVPTLMLNALNDPFLPAAALPSRAQASPAITLEYPAQGGHVGFVMGPFPGRIDWLPQRLLAFFAARQGQG